MKDNTNIIGELIGLAQTREQVIFLKELDPNLITEREEHRREVEHELRITKSVYTNVVETVVEKLARGY